MMSERRLKQLADFSEFISRGITPAYIETGGVSVINQKCIRNGCVDLTQSRKTDPIKKRIPPDKFIKKFDILVNSTGLGTLGRVGQIFDNVGELTVDNHVTIVRPNAKQIDPTYLGYVVKNLQPNIEALAEGLTGQTELSRRRLGELSFFLLHTLSEQQKIADCLSSLDKLIEAHDQKLKALQKHQKGLMQVLFPRNGEKVPKLRFPEFQDVREWEERRFDEIFLKQNIKKYQIKKNDYHNSGIYPIVDQGKNQISGYCNNHKKLFKCPNDGVIVFGDHTCILKFIKFDFVVGADGTHIFITKQSINRIFCYQELLNFNLQSIGYQRHFSCLRENSFLLPTHPEQQKIADCLSSLDNLIEAHDQKLKALQKHQKCLMQQLFPSVEQLEFS